MNESIATLAAGESLVWVRNGATLPLTLEMVRPHEPRPRFLPGSHAFLVAPDPYRAELFALAVDAAELYARVDLARETTLRLPVSRNIEHQARIRVAKVRASNLYSAMRASFRRARSRDEVHGRLLAFGSGLGSDAIASWQNEAFDTLTAWGDLQRFRDDPSYAGVVVCRTTPEDDVHPQWLRLPRDERILLDHGLSDREREVAATPQEAKASTLGITEVRPNPLAGLAAGASFDPTTPSPFAEPEE